jgi:hypothetical protein
MAFPFRSPKSLSSLKTNQTHKNKPHNPVIPVTINPVKWNQAKKNPRLEKTGDSSLKS